MQGGSPESPCVFSGGCHAFCVGDPGADKEGARVQIRYVTQRAQAVRAFFLAFGKAAVIYPAAGLAASAGSMLALGMVFYLREVLRAGGAHVGAIFATWSLVYALGCLVIRPLTDAFRPRYLLAIAAFASCLLTLGLWLNRVLFLAYVLYGLMGAFTSLFWPPLMGWLSAGLEGTALGRAMARFSVSWSLGAIFTPPLAGWLSERKPGLPILASLLLYFLNGCIIIGAALALPRVRRDRHESAREKQVAAVVGSSTPLRFPAWVGLVTTYLMMGMIANIFPLAALEELRFSKSLIGVLFLVRAAATTCGFLLLGRIATWHFRGWPMVMAQIALAATLVLLIFARHPLAVALALVAVGMLVAYGYVNSLFHGLAGSANRAARGAVHEALLSIGIVVGSFAGGVLYQHRSMSAAYEMCIVVLSVAACGQAAFLLRLRRRATSPR